MKLGSSEHASQSRQERFSDLLNHRLFGWTNRPPALRGPNLATAAKSGGIGKFSEGANPRTAIAVELC